MKKEENLLYIFLRERLSGRVFEMKSWNVKKPLAITYSYEILKLHDDEDVFIIGEKNEWEQ